MTASYTAARHDDSASRIAEKKKMVDGPGTIVSYEGGTVEFFLSKLAQKAVAMAIKKSGREYGKPVCISVCDACGLLVAFHRDDGAPLRSINIAIQKGYTAVRMGSITTAFAARLRNEGVPASAFCDDRLTPLAGGVPVADARGVVRAGIGISGLKPEEDDALAASIAKAVSEEL